jgi:hypothetical protein
MKINTTQFAAVMAYSSVRVGTPSVRPLQPSGHAVAGVNSVRSAAAAVSVSALPANRIAVGTAAVSGQPRTTLVNCITDPGRETWRPPV